MAPQEPSLRKSMEWLPEGHRKLRIRQILLAVEGGVITLIVFNLLFGNSHTTTLTLTLAAVALIFMLALLQRGYVWTSAYLTLGMMTLVCSILMWENAGLRDTALLGFPAILYFTTILGSRALFYSVLVYAVVLLSFMGALDVYGLRNFEGPPLTWDNVADVIILTGLVGFTMKLLSDDLRGVLKGLETENTNAREAEERALHLSQHDGLTGLPNRLLGEDRFNHALTRLGRSGGKVAVLFVDIDHFKAFNDSLGHSLGDNLICEIGRRISSAVRDMDSVCRYGGDEFIVILESLPSRDWAETCARKILETIVAPIPMRNQQLEVTVSIGIAIAPDDGLDYNNVCRKADMAMYKAKDFGRNTVRYYDEAMNRESERQMQLISGLRQAIRNNEFKLCYQPQFELATGKVVGAEALIRWTRSDGTVMYPNDFIPVAEETHLIKDIGRWVLREACIACSQWHAAGFDDLTVAANVSPLQLERGELESEVREALSISGLAPKYLQLELTESTLIDNSDEVRSELSRIYHLGVELAIDDFGTGYSNLEYLSRLETGSIKIDKSFVQNWQKVSQNESIITTIVQLADSLGLSTTAEGLEDTESMRRLRELGCKVGQGYYWAKAMDSDELISYLKARRSSGVLSIFPGAKHNTPPN